MEIITIATGILGLGLMGYLFYVLFKGENL
ncbi:K(+)-transporting ATPase subunit F [Eubacterium sp. AM05-23]|uniref:K(+)-transporting ATPase subunit F n=1 Tax=Eubacterium maltosivorans TaxID=2041044 RepID=A0A4P9C5N9_EUBML|nr:K(+)-transporting ATPase subunit F [Eubacterium limosum]QCT69961.1 K(+)-transporting ATPase subunit F [Eubacterium maltosivorans]RHO59540.1 K(+)-transporting ATPase subunit F [Eubacterium sp. AM05-23]WPK80656.1 hypothetical protein EUMA32_20680 [Eubacterium maltosivorans]SDO25583.1 K+-transporting ATPase, KdpF subunit [Eubacterium maltosivorans]